MKHSDIVFGTAGTAATFGLGFINVALGCVAGVLTVGILALRFRREWLHRDDPPSDT